MLQRRYPMAVKSRIIGFVFVVLAFCCLPFLFGTTEETVGGGISWMIILLSLAGIFFVRASVQAKREKADRELVHELLPNEADRRGEP
jgi:hypothetical protein